MGNAGSGEAQLHFEHLHQALRPYNGGIEDAFIRSRKIRKRRAIA
jgi:hypothetical protein